MNHCVVSGKIVGDIDKTIGDNGATICKFNMANIYYKPKISASEKTILRCVSYGAVAEYVYNELYEGANIIVTGRILTRAYKVNNSTYHQTYIGCDTVSRLDQEDYS